MTLIGAAVDKQRATGFIAADALRIVVDGHSEAAETRLRDKLVRLGELVVWGYQGSASVGSQFQRSLEGGAPYFDWADLIERGGAALAAAQQPMHDQTSALFTGFLGGELCAVEIDPHGEGWRSTESLFIGYGRVAARVALRMANDLIPASGLVTRFRKAMEVTVTEVDGLEPPVSAWRITREGVARAWPLDETPVGPEPRIRRADS